jgi:uncharacterized membrane protein YhaH (DUF805 family)
LAENKALPLAGSLLANVVNETYISSTWDDPFSLSTTSFLIIQSSMATITAAPQSQDHEPNPHVKETIRVSTRDPNVVDKRDIDDTTLFYNTHKDQVRPLTPEVERKLVRKNFWCLLLQTWWISFLIHLDKSTLSSASTMGVFKDVAMSKNEYNRLFILFYLGYLIALWPGAWLAQRVGHKHFITGSLLLWALLIGVHPAVKTGKQMMAVRFLLGMVG